MDKDSSFSEAVKKVVSIGVGAAFMTEDAIKSFLSEFQLPKDIVSGIQNNARVAKEDFVEMMRTELSKKFEKIRKFHIMLSKMYLDSNNFEDALGHAKIAEQINPGHLAPKQLIEIIHSKNK